MSQPYPGVAPLTVHTSGAGAPGVIVSTGAGDVHGNFPIVTEMTGPDKRFAGNIMQASENLTDRQNWMGWRILDIWAGGDYSTANGTISLGGTWKWFPPPGAYAIRVAGTAGGGAALVDVAQNGAGTGIAIAQTGAGLALYIVSGGVTLSSAAPLTQQGSHTKSGTVAWTSQRKTFSTGTLSVFPAEQTDTCWCYSTSADYVITLTDPNVAPLPEGIRCTFIAPGAISAGGTGVQAHNTHFVTIKDHSGTILAAIGFANGDPKSAMIETVNVSGTIKWDVVGQTMFVA